MKVLHTYQMVEKINQNAKKDIIVNDEGLKAHIEAMLNNNEDPNPIWRIKNLLMGYDKYTEYYFIEDMMNSLTPLSDEDISTWYNKLGK